MCVGIRKKLWDNAGQITFQTNYEPRLFFIGQGGGNLHTILDYAAKIGVNKANHMIEGG